MTEKSNGEYLESDINAAAHLHCCYFRILGLRKIEDGRYAFRFEDHDGSAPMQAFLYKLAFQNFTKRIKPTMNQKPSRPRKQSVLLAVCTTLLKVLRSLR